jgi:dienelactone hydrolase
MEVSDMRSFFSVVLLVVFSVNSAWGAVVGKPVQYKAGDTTLKGYLAYDDAIKGKRPGIVVVPEWWGLNEYPKMRARMLAKLGYTALALDVYGDGKVGNTPDEAKALVGAAHKDPSSLQARFQAGLDFLRNQDTVDAKRVAAVGYCFGGGVALEMARAGVDMSGVVSFHGQLATEHPVAANQIKGKLLILTGGADPVVPAEQVKKFEDEMKNAKVDYQVISYPGAKHAFTNKASTAVGKKYKLPIAYDANADQESWKEMTSFFKKLFM